MKQYVTREESILLLASKNELFATKINDFQCKLSTKMLQTPWMAVLFMQAVLYGYNYKISKLYIF